MRAVKRHPDFEADYKAQLRWLVSQEARTQIVQLAEGLHEVVRMLSAFPAAGAVVAENGTIVLRKLIFPRGPFVAWYVDDLADPEGALWLVRLFHTRQKRPSPERASRRSRKLR